MGALFFSLMSLEEEEEEAERGTALNTCGVGLLFPSNMTFMFVQCTNSGNGVPPHQSTYILYCCCLLPPPYSLLLSSRMAGVSCFNNI